MAERNKEEAIIAIKEAFTEMMKVMMADGVDPGDIGGVIVGLGAGWIAAHRGKEDSIAVLDTTKIAIEQHGASLH